MIGAIKVAKKRLQAAALREWARPGAERRVAELRQDLEQIYGIFPELRGGPQAKRHQKVTAQTRRRRRRMSAEGRAKLRASLKKRWAAAKKAGKTKLG